MKKDSLKEEADDRILWPQKIVRNALGKQAAIKRETEEEWIE